MESRPARASSRTSTWVDAAHHFRSDHDRLIDQGMKTGPQTDGPSYVGFEAEGRELSRP